MPPIASKAFRIGPTSYYDFALLRRSWAAGDAEQYEDTKKPLDLPLQRPLPLQTQRCLYGEGAAAPAGALDVRIVELEARALDRLDVVDRHTIQIHLAHLVDHYL